MPFPSAGVEAGLRFGRNSLALPAPQAAAEEFPYPPVEVSPEADFSLSPGYRTYHGYSLHLHANALVYLLKAI